MVGLICKSSHQVLHGESYCRGSAPTEQLRSIRPRTNTPSAPPGGLLHVCMLDELHDIHDMYMFTCLSSRVAVYPAVTLRQRVIVFDRLP